MSNWLPWASVRAHNDMGQSDTSAVGLRTVCWLSDEVDCPSLSWSFFLLSSVWIENKHRSFIFRFLIFRGSQPWTTTKQWFSVGWAPFVGNRDMTDTAQGWSGAVNIHKEPEGNHNNKMMAEIENDLESAAEWRITSDWPIFWVITLFL